ncbi:HdeD family acid-resistance protein [Actinocorallia lasiicapitis]
MFDQLARNWWLLALRGAFAILFGIVAWVWPGITVWALAILFGAYALVDGVIAVAQAIGGGSPGQSRGWLAFAGVCGIGLGLLALIWPGVTAFALIMVIGAWAVVTGIFEIIAAIAMRKEIDGEWWNVAAGVVSVLFGGMLLFWPASGGLALIWVIGLFSIVFGIAMVIAGFRLKGAANKMSAATGTASAH